MVQARPPARLLVRPEQARQREWLWRKRRMRKELWQEQSARRRSWKCRCSWSRTFCCSRPRRRRCFHHPTAGLPAGCCRRRTLAAPACRLPCRCRCRGARCFSRRGRPPSICLGSRSIWMCSCSWGPSSGRSRPGRMRPACRAAHAAGCCCSRGLGRSCFAPIPAPGPARRSTCQRGRMRWQCLPAKWPAGRPEETRHTGEGPS